MPQPAKKRANNPTKRFITSLIYPANVVQAKSLNSTLLAEDVIGRVDITGLFPGRELSTEYLYGLFANFTPTPDSFNFLGTPISTNLVRFAGAQNIVSFSMISQHNIAALDFTFPQEFNMWVTYNSAGEVSQYDISARRVDRTFDYVLNATMAAINAASPVQVLQFLTGVLAKSVCSTANTYCKGTNQQYPDEEHCINFLETSASVRLTSSTLIRLSAACYTKRWCLSGRRCIALISDRLEATSEWIVRRIRSRRWSRCLLLRRSCHMGGRILTLRLLQNSLKLVLIALCSTRTTR
jgi:hypothetical protein